MNTYEAIKTALGGADHILKTYISDMDDKDLFLRVVPEAHHIAWQLGHLISSENWMMEAVKPGVSPKLPDGFKETYSTKNGNENDPTKFHTKAVYLELLKKQRAATLQILESLSESDLDKPGPEKMRNYAPTIGAIMILQGNHTLMHAGQWVPLRRKLGKPVLI